MTKRADVTTPERCRFCRFYMRQPYAERGQCRRYPPSQLNAGAGRSEGAFPIINYDDWCGEYAPRDAEDDRR